MSKLVGIDAIGAFAEKDYVTLDGWRLNYNFPMWQVESVWVSSQEKIMKWCEERGVSPKTVTVKDIKRFEWLKAKKDIAAKDKSKLIGIREIEAFAEKKYVTLNDWRLGFGFPMWQEEENGIWVSTRAKIIKWYEERRVDPKAVSERSLEIYKYKKMEEAGKTKLLKRKLNGLNEIVEFAGFSMATVYSWTVHWENCPIKKRDDDTLYADADELLEWMNGKVVDVVVNS